MNRDKTVLNTSIVSIILWYTILYLCRFKLIYPVTPFVTAVLFILPTIFIIYHGVIEMDYLKKNKNDKKEKEDILLALAREKDLANIIPVIIFGFGHLIMLKIVKPKISKLIIPFLVMSLLLGTVIPYVFIYNSFKNCSNRKLLITEILLFASESAALTILIACCITAFLKL